MILKQIYNLSLACLSFEMLDFLSRKSSYLNQLIKIPVGCLEASSKSLYFCRDSGKYIYCFCFSREAKFVDMIVEMKAIRLSGFTKDRFL